jgi:hypothetical protein
LAWLVLGGLVGASLMLNDPTLKGQPRPRVMPPSGRTGIAQALVSQATPGAQSMLQGLQPGPPQVINPYKMRVFQTAAQSFTGGQTTVMAFDTASYDTMGGFNRVTHQYTVKTSGWYTVTAQGAFITTSGSLFQVFIDLMSTKHGAFALSEGENHYPPTAGGADFFVRIVDTVYLLAGDVTWITVNPNLNCSLATPVGDGIEIWAMHLISTT